MINWKVVLIIARKPRECTCYYKWDWFVLYFRPPLEQRKHILSAIISTSCWNFQSNFFYLFFCFNCLWIYGFALKGYFIEYYSGTESLPAIEIKTTKKCLPAKERRSNRSVTNVLFHGEIKLNAMYDSLKNDTQTHSR